MKKLLSLFAFFFSYLMYSQNTIPTTTVVGALSVNDSLNVTNNIHTTGDIKAGGNVRITNDIKIDGISDVNKLKVNEKILMPGNIEISSKPNATTGKTDIIIGPSTNPGVVPDVDQCSEMPQINSTLSYQNGKMQFWGTGAYGTRALTVGFDGNQGFIDAAGGGYTPNANKLLINYYCGKDIYMCTGTGFGGTSYNPNGNRGGVVSMGPNVEIGMPQRDMNIGLNMNVKPTMQKALMINSVASGAPIEVLNITSKGGLNIYTQSSTPLDATFGPDYPISIFNRKKNRDIFKISAVGEIFMTTENANGPSIKINNVDLTKDVFVVFPNGMTQIGAAKPKTGGQAANAMLSVDGLILAKEIKVAIAATHWADFVFEKDYKLIPLKEVEQYVNINKHLPGIPSATEVESNGVNLGESNTLLLQKIEELTLYLIEQNKRIEKLETENNKLRNKN